MIYYEQLDDRLREYVDALTAHAQTALWPERSRALESFRRGIKRSDEQDIKAAVAATGADLPLYLDPSESLFRLVLTAYLEQLGPDEVNNPDQASLYAQSLDQRHTTLSQKWFNHR